MVSEARTHDERLAAGETVYFSELSDADESALFPQFAREWSAVAVALTRTPAPQSRDAAVEAA